MHLMPLLRQISYSRMFCLSLFFRFSATNSGLERIMWTFSHFRKRRFIFTWLKRTVKIMYRVEVHNMCEMFVTDIIRYHCSVIGSKIIDSEYIFVCVRVFYICFIKPCKKLELDLSSYWKLMESCHFRSLNNFC